MISHLKKFIALEREISGKKGAFSLFALFQRENGIGDWDLAVAAPWIEPDKSAALKYISARVQRLPMPARMKLSFVALVDLENNPWLDEFLDEVNVEHGTVEFKNRAFFEKQMKHAYIITSQRLEVHAEAAGK